jgi:hypothetical protein
MFRAGRARTEMLQRSGRLTTYCQRRTIECTARTSADEKPSDWTDGLRNSALHNNLKGWTHDY